MTQSEEKFAQFFEIKISDYLYETNQDNTPENIKLKNKTSIGY